MSHALHGSTAFKVLALVSATTVVGALVIHAGCTPKQANPDTGVSAAQDLPASSAGPAAPASAIASDIGAPDAKAPSGGAGARHMGASKSGMVIRANDLDNILPAPPIRAEAGVQMKKPAVNEERNPGGGPQPAQGPVPGGVAR